MFKPLRGVFSGIGLALLACTSFAQELPTASVEFHIEPQLLPDALNAWAQQAEVQLVWRANATAAQQMAPRVVGAFTPQGALQSLLHGSGFTYSLLDEETVAIRAEQTALVKRIALIQGQGLLNREQVENSSTLSGESSPALEQTARANSKGDAAPAQTKENLEEIVVTGSHIRGAPSSSPILILDREEIERSGYVSAGDVVRTLPQNFSGGASPQVQVGNAPGTNGTFSSGSAPNLRGLGPSSTLTLINGHRLAQDMGYGSIDISLIPLDAVDRIEVVTDGASTVYGSDAVAGVVNFILRKDFDGALTSASLGRATEGGGLEKRFSQLLGTSWTGGSVLLNYEHDRQDEVKSTQRDFTASVPSPYSLLPETERNSTFMSARHEISRGLTAFIDALYTSRDVDAVQTTSFPPSFQNTASVRQYMATAGFETDLPNSWKANLVGSLAQQKTDSKSYTFEIESPERTLASDNILKGKTGSIELRADGSLLTVASGSVRLAVGAGLRRESFDDYYIDGLTNATGDRDVSYVYSEIAAPIVAPSERVGLKRLDLVVSGRYERYSDVGNKAVPKIGIVYSPANELRLLGSWGKSFRAPTLSDLHSLGAGLILLPIADPSSSTGQSIVLLPQGGNTLLKPETATSLSFSAEYNPDWLDGLNIATTYYKIAYDNRIGTIPSVFSALTDSVNEPFVTRMPSPALQQSFIDTAPAFFNFTGLPLDPTTIAAIVDLRPRNVARQNIDGIDLRFSYTSTYSFATIQTFLNGSYLRLRQRVTELAPQEELSGLAFNPPRYKARAGTTWSWDSFSSTAIVNYTGRAKNKFEPNSPGVASWSTVDAQLSYDYGSSGPFANLRASLSVQNVLDKDPPFVAFESFRTGFHYDSVNATPLGRFVTVQLTKQW